MAQPMETPLSDPAYEVRDTWAGTVKERQFVQDALRSFFDCYNVRNQTLDILNHRTPETYWKDSELDYTVSLSELENENDPVKTYQSTISRDKTNVFIAHTAGALLYPDVIAQNPEQGIDREWSRVGTSLLYWAHRNDGWPSENGQQKAERIAHTTYVKGTAFCLDIVTKDGLESEEIPPEELYVPTLWQPNLQKLSVVFRAKLNVTFEEAEAMFGDLENFQYVHKGSSWLDDSFVGNEGLKNSYQGILKEDKVSILYIWKMARPKELKEMIAKRKVWSSATRGTFYNVLINGVPMFPIDNACPYKHGFLPISRSIFEQFRSDFLYGNSVPNKMREDKRWKDGWKTLMRFKGKLGALPPTLIIGGSIDEQIILPSAQTSVPEGVTVEAVPGITGITQSDIQLSQMGDAEIDRSTVAPSAAGQRPDSSQTARAEVIQAAASQKMLEPSIRQFGYFMQSRSFHILLSLLQFINRKAIKKLVVPDQTLADGAKGSFEMIFEDVSKLEDMDRLTKSFDILKGEQTSRKNGQPKDTVYVSPSQIRDMKFFLFSDSTAGMEDKNFVKQQEFQKFLTDVLLARPDLADAKGALQYLFDIKGWPQRILTNAQPQPSPSGAPSAGGQLDLASMLGGGTPGAPGATGAPQGEGDATASAASQASTGQPMPSLG